LFVDRVNRRAVIAGNFLLQATSVVLMLSGPGPMLLYVACAMFGLGVGNTTSLPSVIVQAEFPKAAFAQVVSTIIAINQFTYSFGPGLLGWLRDGFGSYHASLAVCLVLQLAAVAILPLRRLAPWRPRDPRLLSVLTPHRPWGTLGPARSHPALVHGRSTSWTHHC
jgi:MFS family permease